MIIQDVLWNGKQGDLIFVDDVIKLKRSGRILTVFVFPTLNDKQDYFFLSDHKVFDRTVSYQKENIYLFKAEKIL